MTKIRVTITWEYEANPQIYETNDPDEMAEIDKKNWHIVPELCLQQLEESWDTGEVVVKVEPVE